MLTWLAPDDWAAVLLPTQPPLEMVVRISLIYLFLFFTLRFALKREWAALGITDLLVLVLLADAVQNGMAGASSTVGDALILAATLVVWNWLLDYAPMRWRSFRRLIRPAPLLLIRDGRIIEANLRHELLTPDELLGEVHLHGLEHIEDVKFAFMETDGRISVIPKDQRTTVDTDDRRRAV